MNKSVKMILTMLTTLLIFGAIYKISTRDPIEELSLAVNNADIDSVRALLNAGVPPDSKDSLGRAPLHLAAMNGDNTIIELLLDNGADINIIDSYDSLADPVSKPYIAYLDTFFRDDGFVKDQTKSEKLIFDMTPLAWAVMGKKTKTVELLLAKGADVNKAGPTRKETPLHHASSTCNPELARILLKNGADPLLQNESGNTPLHCCGSDHWLEVSKVLIDNGGMNEKYGWKGIFTPLHVAICWKAPQRMKLLLENGADVNAKSRGKYSCLEQALRRTPESREMVEVLIAHGANVNEPASNGEPFLHKAINDDNTDIFNILIKAGADVRQLNNKRETALAHARRLNRTEMIKTLESIF